MQKLVNGINDIKEDVFKGFKDRLSSPFYGYFILSWIIWNWQILYVTVFIDSNLIYQKFNLLKLEYLNDLVFNQSNINAVVNLIIGPLLSVIFLVWVAPLVTHPIYKKVESDKWKLKKIDAKLETDYAIVKKEKIETQIEVSNAKKKLFNSDPKVIWENEFYIFSKQNLFLVDLVK